MIEHQNGIQMHQMHQKKKRNKVFKLIINYQNQAVLCIGQCIRKDNKRVSSDNFI